MISVKVKAFLKISVLAALILAVLPPDAAGQHYVGVRGGYGSGTSRFYPRQDMGSVWGLYSGGVSWKFFTQERVVGGIEVDALFMQQGFKRYGNYVAYEFGGDPTDTTGVYTRTVNSIMVPIFWQPHAYMFQKKMRVYLNLGVTFSYNINSRYEVYSSRDDQILREGKYPMKLVRDNRWGYGLCGGGGAGWSFGRMEVLGEVRYYIGYSDILRNSNIYEDNPLRSPLDGLQLTLGVYYRFGKPRAIGTPLPAMEPALLPKMEAEDESAVSENVLPGSVADDGRPEMQEYLDSEAADIIKGEGVAE